MCIFELVGFARCDFCTPAIAVAEMVSNIEVESQTSQSNSPATDTKTEESTTTSENAESTSQTVEDTSNSQPEKRPLLLRLKRPLQS